jgi:undecaprenyl-diphosphatase
MIEIIQAVILGIVEGLTEFLPISSTGHLIVSEKLLGYKDTAEIFTVVIQVGAIAAVIWHYRRDLWSKITGFFRGDQTARHFIYAVIFGTLPALIIGFLIKDWLDVIAVARTVGISLIIGGILIWLIETYHKPKKSDTAPALEKITTKQAIKIGLYQIFALIPGVSRSGATIMGGLLSGVDRLTATAFSFYLSIPILVLASAYQLIKGHSELNTVSGGGMAILVGTIVAFFTALVSIKWLLKFVSTHDFKPFAYYRIIIGIIILIFVV